MNALTLEQAAKGREMHLCLARGSRVLTRERGYVPIETMQIGENALTHMGRWRPVEMVANTGVRPVITVSAQGVPGLTLTPDHNLWVRKSDWVRERDGAEHVEPSWMEAQSTLGGYLNLKLPPVDDGSQPDDWLTWWIAGRWLADGHFGARGSVYISCGNHKLPELRMMLGDRAGTSHDAGSATQVRLRTRDSSILPILQRCGGGASGKHLPPEAFLLDEANAASLLNGYLSGDGHLVAERDRWMATSVSRDLLLGLSMLVQRVHGTIPSLRAGRPPRIDVIMGRAVDCKQEWTLSFDLPSARRKRPFILDDGAWKKVRSLEDAGEAETWCLRVAEDASFTAEGCIVKNCPLQFDIVDRLVVQRSMPGDLVYDPFGGLMTVPLRAVKLGRSGAASELNPGYFDDGVRHLRAHGAAQATPSLFDLLDMEEAA